MCYNACKIQVRALHGAGIRLNFIVLADKECADGGNRFQVK